METFGVWLAREIAEKRFSVLAFAKLIGTSHTTVQAWIHDKREPSREDMQSIATGLEIPVATVGLAFIGLLPEQSSRQTLPAEVAMFYAISDLVERLDTSYRAAILDWVRDHYGAEAVEHAREALDRRRRQA